MGSIKVEMVKRLECQIGEGPHWDDNTQTLLFLDISSSTVYRWNPATDDLKSVVIAEPNVGAVVPRRKGGLVVAAGHRFSFLNEKTGELQLIKELNLDRPQSRFNDGKCDPAGRFWAGTMGLEEVPSQPIRKQGTLFSLHKDLSVTKHIDQLDISNGLSWSSDNKTMYFIDSLKFSVDAYDYDLATGEISNMREVVKFDRETDGIPDGHCIDTDGNLWVAMFFTGQVIKVDPKTGEKSLYVKVSDTAVKTTSVCFGGPNRDELYVTSARNKPLMNDGSSDVSGSIFKITGTGAKGLPAAMFEG